MYVDALNQHFLKFVPRNPHLHQRQKKEDNDDKEDEEERGEEMKKGKKKKGGFCVLGSDEFSLGDSQFIQVY